MEPEQGRQVDAPGRVLPGGQALVPAGKPGLPQGLDAGPLQALQHRWQDLRSLGQQVNRLQVQVEIAGLRRANTDRVHPRPAQAEQVVDDDRMQGGAELQQALGGVVQVAALVGGADQEHAHVVAVGSGNRRSVVLADQVPVQVDEIETVAGNRLQDQGQGGMGGKAHRTDPPLVLPAPGHLQAATGAQGLVQVLGLVDAMDRQQVDPAKGARAIEPKPLETEAEFGFKTDRILLGRQLGLEQAIGIGALGQQPAELALGGAVVAGRFNVVQAACHGSLQGAPQVGLAVWADLVRWQVAPAVLKAHAPQGQQRHGQLGAAEAAGGNRHWGGGQGGSGARQGPLDSGMGGQTKGLDHLAGQLGLEPGQLLVGHPVDAIHRTGVDRFLDQFGAIAILAQGPGAAPKGLDQEGQAGHMGAVTAADADGLIDPNRLLA